MKIAYLDQEKVLKEAQKIFKGKYIQVLEDSFYTDSIEDGMYNTPIFHNPIVISTGYFYEFLNVKGNNTLSKLPLTLISVQNSKWDVIYQSDDYYYAYVDNNEVNFSKVEEFRKLIPYDKFEKI